MLVEDLRGNVVLPDDVAPFPSGVFKESESKSCCNKEQIGTVLRDGKKALSLVRLVNWLRDHGAEMFKRSYIEDRVPLQIFASEHVLRTVPPTEEYKIAREWIKAMRNSSIDYHVLNMTQEKWRHAAHIGWWDLSLGCRKVH